MVVSTGRANLDEISDCITTIKKCNNNRIALLQCVSNYPAAYEDLNLNTIINLKSIFKVPVGFSDHSNGIEVSIAAVALGAIIIEKHFTLDKNDIGPDHRASTEPEEFKMMVNAIRNVELALGDGIKRPAESEIWGRINVRKGLIANRNIPKGRALTSEMISIKRPCKGIEPKNLEDVVGKITKKNIKKDEPIKWEIIEN
jgi:sialic acid synthase SpsE